LLVEGLIKEAQKNMVEKNKEFLKKKEDIIAAFGKLKKQK